MVLKKPEELLNFQNDKVLLWLLLGGGFAPFRSPLRIAVLEGAMLRHSRFKGAKPQQQQQQPQQLI